MQAVVVEGVTCGEDLWLRRRRVLRAKERGSKGHIGPLGLSFPICDLASCCQKMRLLKLLHWNRSCASFHLPHGVAFL